MYVIWTTYGTTKNIERNVCIDTKKESKDITSVWERGLAQILSQNGCMDVIFQSESIFVQIFCDNF